MTSIEKPKFSGGLNIAIKIPKAHYEKTINFYTEVLGFDLKEISPPDSHSIAKSYSCQFGLNTLWFDQVDNYSKADVWLEIKTNNIEQAEKYLIENGIEIRNEVEKLPENLKAHWISDPSGIIYLLYQSENQ